MPRRGAARAVLLAAATPSAHCWHDNGHMLTAEIALQQLSETEVEAINDVLADWRADYPDSSDMVSAAVWPDVIKCRRPSSYCRKPRADSLEAFSAWHFDNKPWNPDNLTHDPQLDLKRLTWDQQPSASWLLTTAVDTFGSSQTRFAFNLMLRFTVHIIGDIHQPLHTVAGFFDDSQYGDLPGGDQGGNLIHIVSDIPGVNNLHSFWDSAAGLYTLNWPFTTEQNAQLKANATKLAAEYPKDSKIFAGRYKNGTDLAHCWTPPSGKRSPDNCAKTFVRWVNESWAIAVRDVYPGVVNGGALSAAYVASARRTSREQIALGGYRLADVLRQVARRMARQVPPRAPCHDHDERCCRHIAPRPSEGPSTDTNTEMQYRLDAMTARVTELEGRLRGLEGKSAGVGAAADAAAAAARATGALRDGGVRGGDASFFGYERLRGLIRAARWPGWVWPSS